MKEASVIMMRNVQGQLLVLNRNFPPTGYGLPGGKKEEGETHEECVIREVKEETGIDISKHEIVESFTNLSHGGAKVKIYSLFPPIREQDIILSDEHSDFRFVSLEDNIDWAGNTLDWITQK